MPQPTTHLCPRKIWTLKYESGKEAVIMPEDVTIFIDEETLTMEEWEELRNAETEEQG